MVDAMCMERGDTSEKLQKFITQLHSQAPVIGWELRRMAVKALVKNGSSEAMDALANTLVQTNGHQLHRFIMKVLLNLAEEGNLEARDALCRLMIANDHPFARNVIFHAQYLPADPKLQEPFANTLGRIVIRTKDSRLRYNALTLLEKMAAEGKTEARETLCGLVIAYNHPLARKIVLHAEYLPHNPYQRALFCVLTGQWEHYEQFDFDHRLLRTAYKTANKNLQKQIASRTKQDGRADLLASFVTGGTQAEKMTGDDWDAMLAVLDKHQAWNELWRLAQVAPALWSVRILLRLQEVDWRPTVEIEQAEFRKLVRLAETCQQHRQDTSGWLVPSLAMLEGYANEVQAFTFTAEGRILASGFHGNTVRVWNLPDELSLPMLHDALRMSRAYLAYCAYRRRSSSKTLRGHTQPVSCIVISPDKETLASGSDDGTIRIWNFPGGMPIHVFSGHHGGVQCLAYTPDGQTLLSSGSDNFIRLWDVVTARTVRQVTQVAAKDVRCVTIGSNGMFASGHGDHAIRVWSLPEGKLLQTLDGHHGAIASIVISPDNSLLASGSEDTAICLWKLPEGGLYKILAGHTGCAGQLCMSRDGLVLVSGSDDQLLHLWQLPEGRLLKTLHGHQSRVSSLAISPDGRMLVSGDSNKSVRLWGVGKIDLGLLSAEKVHQEEFRLLQERLRDTEVIESERSWVQFLLELMYWRQRFDIEIGDALRGIPRRAFDIEIE